MDFEIQRNKKIKWRFFYLTRGLIYGLMDLGNEVLPCCRVLGRARGLLSSLVLHSDG